MADIDNLADMFSKFMPFGDKHNTEQSDKADKSDEFDSIFGNIDIDAILGIMEMFEQMNKSDKNTDLLLALKPHLREENKDKIDKAIKIMKLMTLIPLLRESGIFK